MKSYQSAVATIVTLTVAVFYCVLTAHVHVMQQLMVALVLATIWCIIALQRNKVEEDRAYNNKYKTTTTTCIVDESEVPAEIVARMKANMGWDLEGFEATLKPVVLEKSDLPFEVFIKDFEMMENDPLCNQLDSVIRELDDMIILPPAPEQKCYVL